MTSYLRRIGLVAADGTPSELYRKCRNPNTSGTAIAQAIRIGYGPLYEHNEYAHDLSEEELRGLIIQVTGSAGDARSVDLTLKCIVLLKAHATFDGENESTEGEEGAEEEAAQVARPQLAQPQQPPLDGPHQLSRRLGMNLSYTINLNLPASTDIAVFNAIFKSLKENLLKHSDER